MTRFIMKAQIRFTPAQGAAANTARTKDKLLTFAEYVTSENAETTRNRPYAVKKVLEDNLLRRNDFVQRGVLFRSS